MRTSPDMNAETNDERFFALAEQVFSQLRSSEQLFLSLDGERSDFVRLNRNRVRQAGAVQTQQLGLTLIDRERQLEGSCDLSGDPDSDRALVLRLLGQLRARVPHLPADPYLNHSETPSRSHRALDAELPPAAEVIASLTEQAEGLDLVGIYAAGDIASGLASSIGHRHWHQSRSSISIGAAICRATRRSKTATAGSTGKRARCRCGSSASASNSR